jgi:hypothetical protein
MKAVLWQETAVSKWETEGANVFIHQHTTGRPFVW